MLIAPGLDGLVIELDGNITSRPYIDMTLSILNKLSIFKINDNTIIIKPKKDEIINTEYKVEADWSSASYFSIVALSKNIELSFLNFRKDSFQGDINVCSIMNYLVLKLHFKMVN